MNDETTFERREGKTVALRAGRVEATYYDGCRECATYLKNKETFFPTHIVSSYCESGKHPHCTCDMCF